MTNRHRQQAVFLAMVLSAGAAHAEFSIDDRFIIQQRSQAAESSEAAEPVVVGQPYRSARGSTSDQPSDQASDQLSEADQVVAQEPVVEPPEVTQKTLELIADIQASRDDEARKIGADTQIPAIEVEYVEPIAVFSEPLPPPPPPCVVVPGTLESNLVRLSSEFGGKPIIWLPSFEIPVEVEATLHRETFDECVSEIVRSLQVVGAPIRAVDNRNAIVIRER